MVQAARRPTHEPSDDLAKALSVTPLVELEHLLKVAGSVSQDANKAWADVWAELKTCTTGGGMITPEAEKGFVPQCGWPEFLEKFWAIKFYLDSMQRICMGQR